VSWLKRWLAISLGLGFLALSANAQSIATQISEETAAAAPDTGIVDESKIISRESEAYKNIITRLRELREKRGFKIYLVVEPVLIATTPPDLAARLRDKWLPEGDGLVIVFESDSRNLGISQDLIGHPDQADRADSVPAFETSAAISRTTAAIDSKLSPEPFLESLVTKLTTEFEVYFKSREAPPAKGRGLRLGLLIVGAVALLGLVGIALGGLIRHSSMTVAQRFRFPLVDRPERLGAPCGGSVTSRRFSAPVG